MTWLPGYTIITLGPSGGTYDRHDNPKLVWHTTEGNSLAGAEAAFARYPPHIGVDPVTGEKHQYIDLDRSAYSLGHSDAEDSFAIQVEVVGRASESWAWSSERLVWLGENVVAPVADAVGVPDLALPFYGEGSGYVLASPDSPVRLTLGDWDNFAGHVGHQHCPGDDHWDPGALDITAILAAAHPPASEAEPEEDPDMANLTICAAEGATRQYITDLATFKTPIQGEDDWGATVWSLIASGAHLYYQDVNNPVRVPAATLDKLPTVEA